MTKHLSSPSLQLSFHKSCQFMSVLCMLLHGFPFFCLTGLTNVLENIAYHAACIFLGSTFTALEASPTFAVPLSQHKREQSLLATFPLSNSGPIPICWGWYAGYTNFQRKSNCSLQSRHTTHNPFLLHVRSFCMYHQKTKELYFQSNPINSCMTVYKLLPLIQK